MIRGFLAALALLFVLSGAAGLFYEVVWSRYLSLFVGHDAYAQILTLVIFLGGMGIGALLVSRHSARLRDPLFVYAIVEAIIGVLGLSFHDLFYLPVTGWAYDHLFPAVGGGTAALLAKWAIAGGLILPPSILLGATFPLMCAGALRRMPDRPGRILSLFYFSNSLGAAAGVLVAGFVLFALAGLPGTLVAAGSLNLVVALGALVMCRAWPLAGREIVTGTPRLHDNGAEVAEGGRDEGGGSARLLVVLAAGTALASFIYEVGWLRMLSLVLGSSTHSFELILSAFILGLALGAWWIGGRADRLRNPLRTLAIVQLVMGVLAVASLPLYLESFRWSAAVLAAVARTDQGFVAYSVARYLMCLAIMLPATFCAGMTLPLITRMLMRRGAGERAIGGIYAANTIGSIVGAGLTGLVLIPVLGLKGALVAGGALDIMLGLLIVRRMTRTGHPTGRLAQIGAGGLLLAGLALWLVPWDQELLSSGVFRWGQLGPSGARQIVFHADGRTATVHTIRVPSSRTLLLSTNGKPDGSLPGTWFEPCDTVAPLRTFSGDDGTQAMLALVLLAHAPHAATAAVIGHGTGMSSHLLLGSPRLRSLTTIEIEPAIIAGARAFYPANRRVADDPRSKVVIDDARSFFAGANARYDLMLSEPSNPWVTGVSGLFTTEFYRSIRRYLAPGAVFGQWLQTYELPDDLVLSVLSAVHQSFADYRVYLIDGGNLLVVATPEGKLRVPDWSVTRSPDIQRDFCRLLPLRASALDRLLLVDRAGLAPLLDRTAGANSDFYPLLDLGAERARFLQRSATGVVGLGGGVVDYIGDPALRPTTWDSATTSPLILAPGVRAMLRAIRMRQVRKDSAWADEAGSPDRYQLRGWLRGTEGAEPPENWRGWAGDFWTVRGSLSGGGAPVDTSFFSGARQYAVRAGAPGPVVAVIDFGERLAGRDLPAAAAAAEVLVLEAKSGRLWIPADDLVDGAVRSLLAAGRPDRARYAMDILLPRTTRPRGDLRLALLSAYLERGEAGGHPTNP